MEKQREKKRSETNIQSHVGNYSLNNVPAATENATSNTFPDPTSLGIFTKDLCICTPKLKILHPQKKWHEIIIPSFAANVRKRLKFKLFRSLARHFLRPQEINDESNQLQFDKIAERINRIMHGPNSQKIQIYCLVSSR